MGRIREFLGSAFGSILTLLLIGLYGWGVGYGFVRFGVGDGVAALTIPPFAWFRGVSVLWTPPEWREDWELRTGNLAYIFLYVEVTQADVAYQLRQYEDRVKKWIRTVPRGVRSELREKSMALRDAYLEYSRQVIGRLTEKDARIDVQFILDSKAVQQHVDVFRSEKGIMDAWTKYGTQQVTTVPLCQAGIAEQGDETVWKVLRDKYPELADGVKKQFDAKIAAVFGD